MNLGLAALLVGELDQSRQMLEEGLQIARQIVDRRFQSVLVGALGCRVASSNPRLAARLLGASEKLRAEVAAGAHPTLAPLVTRAVCFLKSALGAGRFEVEFNSGQRLTRSAALALALGEPASAAVKAPHNLAKAETSVGQGRRRSPRGLEALLRARDTGAGELAVRPGFWS